MKKVLFFAMLLGGMLASCTNSNKQTTDERHGTGIGIDTGVGQGVPAE